MNIDLISGQDKFCYSGFYLCKLYHQGANIYWVIDQITQSMSQIQRASVSCGPMSHATLT